MYLVPVFWYCNMLFNINMPYCTGTRVWYGECHESVIVWVGCWVSWVLRVGWQIFRFCSLSLEHTFENDNSTAFTRWQFPTSRNAALQQIIRDPYWGQNTPIRSNLTCNKEPNYPLSRYNFWQYAKKRISENYHLTLSHSRYYPGIPAMEFSKLKELWLHGCISTRSKCNN